MSLQDLIKQLILNDIGFDAVNHAVRLRLVEEFKSLCPGCNFGRFVAVDVVIVVVRGEKSHR